MSYAYGKSTSIIENGGGFIIAGPILMVIGIIGGFLELDQLRIALQSEADPTPITCEALTTNGPTRLYVKLTDFRPYFDGAAKTIDPLEERVLHACIPVRPSTGDRLAPKDIKVLVEISHISHEDDIKTYFEHGDIVGVIKNKGTAPHYAEHFEQQIPGFDPNSCWTIWTEQTPQDVGRAGVVSFLCMLLVGASMLSIVHGSYLCDDELWVARYNIGLILSCFPAGIVFWIARMCQYQETIKLKQGAQILTIAAFPCLIIGCLLVVFHGLDQPEFTILFGVGASLVAVGIGLLMIGTWCRQLHEKSEVKSRASKLKALLD